MSGIFEIINLSDFLTENVHPDLYPRLFVMSPTGKLVAYSKPYLIQDIKAEAAIVAMAWKRHSASVDASVRSPFQSLSIETSEYNITARAIQSDLLLVLVGFRASEPDEEFKIMSEKTNDSFGVDYGSNLEKDVAILKSREQTDSKVEALMLQKRKLDKLADTIGEEASKIVVAD